MPNGPDSLDRFAEAALATLDAQGLRRTMHETARACGADGPVVWRDGRRMISFSCNDYLNLSTHPVVVDAAVSAARRYGTGAGASRLVTGNHPLLEELEERLARRKGTPAAIVFGSGYLANAGAIPALAGKGDLVLLDELAHACLFDGARLSGARFRRFRHNDLGHLEALLAAHDGGHVVIATDRVFSMDGDLAPTAEMAALAARHGAWLLTDDAHGFLVLPEDAAAVPLKMGTLSKAAGGYGGYVCASAPVIALLRNRARSFVYSTGLPPPVAAAALAAIAVVDADPELATRPMARAALFCAASGLPSPQSPIVPVMLGTPERALAASATLAEHGFLAAAIRPPTVPLGTARLRLTFSAGHAEGDVLRLADMVRGL